MKISRKGQKLIKRGTIANMDTLSLKRAIR